MGNYRWVWGLAVAFLGACTGVVSTSSSGVGPVGTPPPADTPVVEQSGLRRLSPDELSLALQQVLGPLDAPAEALRPYESAPFDNDYTQQTASVPLIQTYEELVGAAIATVLSDPARRDALLPCIPSGADDAACFEMTIRAIGELAFRRPLSDADVADFSPLLAFAQEASGDTNLDSGYDEDFYLAVELLLAAMLQDTEFLYQVAAGTPTSDPGVRVLSGHEIATKMAFFLWGAPPDTETIQQASRLTDASARRAAALSMLDDPRARAQWTRFHSMWLGYRQLTVAADVRDLLRGETDALIEDVMFDSPRSYRELFLAEGSFMNSELTSHYNQVINAEGLDPQFAVPDASSSDYVWTEYGSSGRRGLLSHGSFLAAFGKFDDTSPTQRGLLIQTRLLCQPVPSPPAELGVNVDNPPASTDPNACKTDRYAQHRDDPNCSSCHDRLDPVGFGLENYDNAGRYRAYDDGRPECTIDGVGSAPELGSFQGPADLAQRLVDTGNLEPCVAQQLMTFALGRELGPADEALLTRVIAAFEAQQLDLGATLAEIVADPSFIYRRDE